MRIATRAALILTSLAVCSVSFAPDLVSAGLPGQAADRAQSARPQAQPVLDRAGVPFGSREARAPRNARQRQPAAGQRDLAAQPVSDTTTARAVRGPRGPRVLPRPQRGTEAIATLGDRIGAVAERNRLSALGLRTLLREDPTAWVASHGELFYVEQAPQETVGSPQEAAPAPAHPTDQTFALHSRPGAARTIFLDFDGATVQGTAWNGTGPGEIADGTHIGWDSDGSPGTFSTVEHGWIQEVWRQVAETYSPFDVDVTTQDLGSATWIRSSSEDQQFGAHVVVTSSATAKAQACQGCLGVAWVGSFDFVDPGGEYQPAWVFADNPGLDPMIVAQAASHEAGHNLGLHHDGTTSQDYYAGTSAWGPIMGSARTRAVSHFSRGEYPDASNTQDDFAVMRSNGLPLRADDHGSTVAAAEQLGRQAAYEVDGVIGTRSDVDVFTLALPCTTDLVVAAAGIGAQAALDLSVEVLDASGVSLALSSPASTYSGSPPRSAGMDAQVRLAGATGTYHVRVDGAGQAASPAGPGWSDYGSLGQYHLTATGCAGDVEGGGGTTGISTVDPSGEPSAPVAPTPAPPQSPPASEPPASDPPVSSPPPGPAAVTRPSAPRIGTASSGALRGPVTAVARWSAPTQTGGAPVTKYRVRAQRRDSANRVIGVTYSAYQRASARSLSMSLRAGRYTFTVVAHNSVGPSAWSSPSRAVWAR